MVVDLDFFPSKLGIDFHFRWFRSTLVGDKEIGSIPHRKFSLAQPEDPTKHDNST